MDASRFMDLKLKGYCCSQLIMQMALDEAGKENEELVTAMRGLCNGAHIGKMCGTLSAAICVIFMFCGREDPGALTRDLTDWFEAEFGSTECEVLLDGDPMKKMTLCPTLVEDTFEKLEELFDDSNIDFK